MFEDLYTTDDDGTVLSVHVSPGAGRTEVVGRHGAALKVKVAAPPTGGRANDAVIELLARTFDAEPSAIELVSGASSRSKRVRLGGVDAETVETLLRPLLEDGGVIGGAGRRRGRS